MVNKLIFKDAEAARDASKHVYEANLYWGGRNIGGDVSPITSAQLTALQSANIVDNGQSVGKVKEAYKELYGEPEV